MLNNEQLNAVNTVAGPVLVIAGPGSGKTMVIAGRVHRMISKYHIKPESILVVTFSRAAATNMKQRYLSISSNSDTKVSFGTFHSIFFQILKTEYGYRSEDILTGRAALRLIMSFLKSSDSALSSNSDYISEIAAEIAYVKSSSIALEDYQPRSVSRDNFLEYYDKYCSYLTNNHMLDFEDILLKTSELFAKKPELVRQLSERYKYLLIDEFQDINNIQYEIIKQLAGPSSNIFAVGDDDQAIYAFRGASPDIMRKFKLEYPEAKVIKLYTNYRSTGEILKSAQQLINHNTNRFQKELSAHNTAGDRIRILSSDSYTEELFLLAKNIKADLASLIPAHEIAILVRTQSEMLSVSTHLLREGIHTSLQVSTTHYQDRFVTPVLAMLSFAKGNVSRENFLQFCNKPARYISREALRSPTVSLSEVRQYYQSSSSYLILKQLDKLAFDLSIIKDLDPASAIHYIRKIAGYDHYLKKEARLSLRELDEKLSLLSVIESEAAGVKSYEDFLNHIEAAEASTKKALKGHEADTVTLRTAHSSKGLEFESVYILNCTEGSFPHKRSITPDEIEEERRMFYVAMTRAKRKLTLSYSEGQHGFGGRAVSRFIQEILEGLPLPQIGDSIFHRIYQAGTVIFVKDGMITVKFDKILVPKVLDYRKELHARNISH